MPDGPTQTRQIPDAPATRTGGSQPDGATTAPGPAADADPVPPTVGRYAIVGEIARGGMGVVYRATDPEFGREVAVKLVRGIYRKAPAAVRRFLDEAAITGQLQHPGIPPAFEVGRLGDGSPFLAMKLIKGHTLEQLLKTRPDPAADRGRFLAVFEKVCDAVGYAHAHNVIHRDLKPANVMVGNYGEVQVMDWGLAKVLTGDPPGRRAAPAPEDTLGTAIVSTRGEDSATQAGSLLGTPAFMPPEQAMGAIDELDARSDVFGLGAILCAVLTGQPPYVGTDAEDTRKLAIRGKLDDTFARLAACRAEPDLVALCRRCLAGDKAGRPADAGAVAAAVAGLRAAADDRARRAELDRAKAEVRWAEQRKRKRVQFALAAAVGLLLAGAGGGGWWADRLAAGRRAGERERAQAEQARAGRAAEAVAAALGRCEDALRAGDADRAGAALQQAEERAAEGLGGDSAGRLERCRADLGLLRALDGVDVFRWTPEGGKLPEPAAVVAEWRGALAGRGDQPGELPGADRVAGSAVRHRILAALDAWLVFDPDPKVRAALAAADPHPFRDAVRAAVMARDDKALAELAGHSDALAQPPGFVAALGQHPASFPIARRRAFLEAALRSRPGDLALLLTLGQWARKTGEFTGTPWCLAAVAAHPRSIPAHNSLGLALLEEGEDVDGAVAEFREVIRLNPDSKYGYNNLGVALQNKGDLAGAAAALRTAIRLDPGNPIYRGNLGNILEKAGDAAGAVAAFGEAVRLAPGNAIYYDHLGGARLRTGDRPGALAAYREASRLDPGWGEPLEHLGSALLEMRDWDGAAAAFEATGRLELKVAGGQGGTFRPLVGAALLGWVQAFLGKANGDAAGLSAATRRRIPDADPVDTLCNVAVAFLGADDHAAAEALGREILAERKRLGRPGIDFSHSLARLGEALVEHGRMAAAEPVLRDCLAIREDLTPDAWWTAYTQSFLGEALVGQNKFAEAEPLLIRSYERLAKTKPPAVDWAPRLARRQSLTAGCLVRLYRATGNSAGESRWRAAAREIAPPPRPAKS